MKTRVLFLGAVILGLLSSDATSNALGRSAMCHSRIHCDGETEDGGGGMPFPPQPCPCDCGLSKGCCGAERE